MRRKRKTIFLIWLGKKKIKNQDPLEFSPWNHRMGWVGRDHKKPSSSTPTAMGRDLISKLVSISREFFTNSTNMSCRTLQQVLNMQHLKTIFLYTNQNIALLKIKPFENRLLQTEVWFLSGALYSWTCKSNSHLGENKSFKYMVEELFFFFLHFKYAEKLRYLYLEIVPYKFWEPLTSVMAERVLLSWPWCLLCLRWKEVAEQNPSTLETDFGAD